MVQEIDFRREVEKKIGSKKKEPSIAAKAATRDRERPTPSITSFVCLRYNLPFMALIFLEYVRILDSRLMSGDRILLHEEVLGAPKMLPMLEP